LQAPWATYTPSSSSAAASLASSTNMGYGGGEAAAAAAAVGSSSRHVGNRNSSSQMAGVLGVGEGALQQKRPATAAAAVGGARKYPWEWASS
jgi:hypothetical protein